VIPLVDELVQIAMAGGDSAALAAIPSRLSTMDHADFVRRVRNDPDCSFAAWEVEGPVCRKPRELTAALLEVLVVELADERRWQGGCG
jgi:hypothetical protein